MRVPDKRGEYQDDSPQVTLQRTQVEQWCNHILNRIELPIRRTLSDAGLSRADINEVILLVGGATLQCRQIVGRITEIFGREPALPLEIRMKSSRKPAPPCKVEAGSRAMKGCVIWS